MFKIILLIFFPAPQIGNDSKKNSVVVGLCVIITLAVALSVVVVVLHCRKRKSFSYDVIPGLVNKLMTSITSMCR